MSVDVSQSGLVSEEDFCEWLVGALSRALSIDPEEIDTSVPYERYGMDSVAAVEITGDLEKVLGVKLLPTLMYDYPTIDAFSEHLAREHGARGALVASAV